MSQIDRDEVASLKAQADLVRLFEADGSVVERDGARHKTCCPFHGDLTPSCVLYDDGGYHCFGCGASGDAISYLRERRKLSFDAALDVLRGGPKVALQRRVDRRRKYDVVMPVPTRAPATRWHHRTLGEPTKSWRYLSRTGALLMTDCRYEFELKGEQKKSVLTWCWARDAEGTEQWTCTRPSSHAPLYGLDRLEANPAATVVLVEGCKCADAVAFWLTKRGVIGMTWVGGANNAKLAQAHDWSALAGRTVVLWPDHEKAGAFAMSNAALHLRAAGALVEGVVDLRGEQLPEGFDIADCIEESQALRLFAKQAPNVDAVLGQCIASFPGDLAVRHQPSASPTTTAQPESLPPADHDGAAPPPADAAPDAPPDANDDIELNDIANATHFLRDHAGRILHRISIDQKHRHWFIWDGRRYHIDEANQIMSLAEITAKRISREYLDQADDLRRQAAKAVARKEASTVKRLRKHAAALAAKADQIQSLKRMQSFVALASSRAAVNVDAKQLDAADYLLNCLNGVVDLRDGRIFPHHQKYLMTKLCPVDYVPGLTDAKLDEVINHLAQDDADLARFMQDALGRTIFGNNDLERFYLWWGPGRSGKGTLMEAVKAVLADYAMTAEFQSFVKTMGARVRDDLDRLHEARMVLASEVEKGEQMAAGVVKAMTGNDTITSRQLFGTYREFRPRMTLHLQCNDKPRVDDQDTGLWGRLVVIPCGPTVPEDRRDPHLKRHLLDPAGGGRAVLSWLVAGAIRTHALKRLIEPAVVTAASADYRRDQDPTREFFAEALLFALPANAERTVCGVEDLLQAYAAFCNGQLLPPKFRLTAHSIARRLESRGCFRKKIRADNSKPTSAWVGVTLPADEHGFRRLTFVPGMDEHQQALASVPVLLSSPPCGKYPSHTRAHARTQPENTDIQEPKNTGTEEQPPQGDPPQDLPPSDTNGFDLGDL